MAARPRFPLRLWTGAVLFVWVNAYLWLLDQDRYQTFLNPSFWWLVIAGLVLSSAFSLAVIVRTGEGHERPTRSSDLVCGALLLLPVLYLPSNEGKTLDSFALTRRAVGLDGTDSGDDPAEPTKRPLPPHPLPPRPVTSIPKPVETIEPERIPLFQLREYFKFMEGKPVITKGMVFDGPKVPEGHFVAFQFRIVCCVADALPIAILTKWDGAAQLKKDQWVEIHGVLGRAKNEGKTIPMLTATSVVPIEKPKNPYGF